MVIVKQVGAESNELQAVGRFLISEGYLRKFMDVRKMHGNHGHKDGSGRVIEGDYYVAYYEHKDFLKCFDKEAKYNGLPIFIFPFFGDLFGEG